PVRRTALNPPPPYCSARPFQSSGKLIWKLMFGAFGSIGLIWPSTLQKEGVAGVILAAGVGALSATANATAGTMAALSITAGPLVTPIAEAGTSLIRPAHVCSGLLPSGTACATSAAIAIEVHTEATISMRGVVMHDVGRFSGAKRHMVLASPTADRGR